LNTLFVLARLRNAVPSSQLAQSLRVLLVFSASLSVRSKQICPTYQMYNVNTS